MSWPFHIAESWRRSLRQAQATKLIVLACLTGALTGAATVAFVELLHFVQWVAIGSADLPLRVLPTVPWYRVLLAPVLGGLVLGPMVAFLAPEAEGHGVPEVIEAVMLSGGRIRRRVTAVKSLASAITIGCGGSVGREGPVVHIGGGVGSAVGQLLRLPAEQIRTLTACGGGAGIAAVFNAPIAGAFFALEVITGNFAMPSFGPVVLASVLATVVSRAYFGDHPAFIVQPYEIQSVTEFAAYLGLGIFCGLVSVAFISVMDTFESLASRSHVPKMLRPAVGGAAIGVMVLMIPNLYGVGYRTMDLALDGALTWHFLAILVPLKIIATSLTLASGGSGGVFLPSLYIGSVAGGVYGVATDHVLGSSAAGSGAYALVGMAGMLAAATHSPITAMILLFEVTGDYKIILPVMIVATVATMVARTLKTDSLYTLKLSRRGIALHRREDSIMRTHTVREIMQPPPYVLRDDTPIGETVRHFLEHEAVQVYVVDAQDHLVGAISIHDIKDPEVVDLGPLVLARDVAERHPHAVAPEDTLADCMEHFALTEDDELPVVRDGKLAGTISRHGVLRVYSSEVLRHEYLGVTVHDHQARSVREYVRLAHGLTVARVPVPASLVGRSLRQANLRAVHGLTVAAVQPGGQGEDQLPNPEAPLDASDVLVIVGRPADIEQFRASEQAGAATQV
jgi:CIC family chloride channel protein